MALFDLMDINKDGRVDFEDFYLSMVTFIQNVDYRMLLNNPALNTIPIPRCAVQLWPKLSQEDEEAAIDKPFEVLDSGWNRPGTGVLTKADYRQAEKELGAVFCAESDKEVTKIFSQLMPDYASQVKMDISVGMEKKLFSRLVAGKINLQSLDKKTHSNH